MDQLIFFDIAVLEIFWWNQSVFKPDNNTCCVYETVRRHAITGTYMFYGSGLLTGTIIFPSFVTYVTLGPLIQTPALP